jgi:hypothetical protein
VRDIDRQAPGLQASCTVQSVSRNPDGSQTTSQLPSCDTGPPPCWRIGPTTCFGQGWIFSVEEPTDWCFEAGINLAVECLACGDPHDPACALPLAQ